jgi:hypothetical protein
MNTVNSELTDSTRRGHSMVEMVVVMSILAGMVAFSWPMFKSPMAKVRLQAAAQEVTSELAKARLKAMQSGVAQVFKVQMHSGKFRVVAVGDDESEQKANGAVPRQSASETDSASTQDHSPLTDKSDALPDDMELPEGICFEEPADESPSAEDEKKVASEDVEEEWKDVAVFYPNGATTDAVVGLHGEPDLHVDVKLSGLTCTAKVGETHRQETR